MAPVPLNGSQIAAEHRDRDTAGRSAGLSDSSPLASATPKGESAAAKEEQDHEDDEECVGVHNRCSHEARGIAQDAPALIHSLLKDVLRAVLPRTHESLSKWERSRHAVLLYGVHHEKRTIHQFAENHIAV